MNIWPTKKLEEVAVFLPKSKRKAGDGKPKGLYPFFSSSPKQNKFINTYDYNNEAIILGTGGGPSIHISKNFSTSADTFVIQPKYKNLTNKFFYFLLLSEIDFLKRGFKGAALKHLSKEYLKQMEVPLPSIDLQKKIVKKIEELFERIDEAKRLREEAQKDASAIIPSALNKIFSVGRKKGWEEKKLLEITEKTEIINPTKNFKTEFPYIDITSVSFCNNATPTPNILSVNIAPSRAKKLVKEGDTIFATTRPYLKNISFIDKSLDGSVASTGFCVIRAKQKLLDFRYLYLVVSSDSFVEKVTAFQKGATYPAVSDYIIFGQHILLPPLDEQKKIVGYLDSLSEKVRELQKFQAETAADLEALKKSILHKAFAGELVKF